MKNIRNIVFLIRNTLKITFRKKGNIVVYLVLPLLGVLLSVVIYNSASGQPMGIGLIDKDGSMLSADFRTAVEGSGGYKIVDVSENDINNKLLGGQLDAVVEIPAGYGDSILKGNAEKMEIVSVKGHDTTIWLEQYINLFTRNLADLSAASGGDRTVFNKMYADYKTNQLSLNEISLKDERTGKLMTQQSLGFLFMFIMLGAGFTSQLILSEKRNRTYYRICSAPVGPWDYIAGNAATSLLIVAMQIVLIQLTISHVFHIKTFVPGLQLFCILLLFGIAAIGISMLITAFSSSSYMASTVSTLVITPTCMLGGCFWPVSYMPETMQKIAYFVPQRWALDAVQKLQAGSGMSGIVMNIVILLAFIAALFLVSIYKFGRTGSIQKFV